MNRVWHHALGVERIVSACVGVVLVAACSGGSDGGAAPTTLAATTASPPTSAVAASTTAVTTDPPPTSTTPPPTTTTPTSATVERPARPEWLGTRVLPLRPDGFGEVQPTPPELVDRRLPPPAAQATPVADTFSAAITEVPPEVLARSTWREGCPVDVGDLRYVTLTYWGFDDRPHRGELIVHTDAAAALVEVFERLYDARFPIEEMRVVAAADLDAPATGDGNNTTAFTCRPVTGSTSTWSQHAYGLAVDVNPFHNPYVNGDVVVPELASAYLDRDDIRPGMVVEGDVVTDAFDAIAWGWGGRWSSLEDWQHFSANGR